jgi:hypothetical protein
LNLKARWGADPVDPRKAILAAQMNGCTAFATRDSSSPPRVTKGRAQVLVKSVIIQCRRKRTVYGALEKDFQLFE